MNSSYWLAAQIAQGNEKVIEYLNQVLTSENNVHRLQRWYLHAIAISGYRPLLELEGKLLLAAKLQEGLRQAIVETMDEGCPESYLYLFSIIYNNGLQRFASVKRSIAVCTGIGEQDSSERITNKYVELIWNFLNHPETAAMPCKARIQSNFIWLYGASDSMIRTRSEPSYRTSSEREPSIRYRHYCTSCAARNPLR